jgi:hypothetical protein
MRPPEEAEPYPLPEVAEPGLPGLPPEVAEPDLEDALALIAVAHGLIPARWTGIHAALNVAEDGLRAAQVAEPGPPQPERFGEEPIPDEPNASG